MSIRKEGNHDVQRQLDYYNLICTRRSQAPRKIFIIYYLGLDYLKGEGYYLAMFNRKKIKELDEWFQAEWNRERNRLNKLYETKRNTQKDNALKNGTLGSGIFANQIIGTELEHAQESSQSLYKIYKRIYCVKGINKKNIKALLIKLDEFENHKYPVFYERLKKESSIPDAFKLNFQNDYQRGLKGIIGELKSTINIELRRGNKADIQNEANKIEQSNSILSIFKWLGLQWKLHKIFAIVITIILILIWFFNKFPTETCQFLKELIQPKK